MNVINRSTLSADVLLDIARPNARQLNDAIWALDSARSMLNKARAGYRASPGIGDGAWDLDTYARRVEAATLALHTVVQTMKLHSLPQDIPPLQRALDSAAYPAGDQLTAEQADFQTS